jgi:hypothetical protein
MHGKLLPLLVLVLLSACSARQALNGRSEPDLSFIRVGMTREAVELDLGHPVYSASNAAGGTTDTYEYPVGAKPSTFRAVSYVILDIISLCSWELIAEQVPQKRVQVEYDRNDTAVLVRKLSD